MGKLQKQLRKWLSVFVPNSVAKEMEQELFGIVEEMRREIPEDFPEEDWWWNPKKETVGKRLEKVERKLGQYRAWRKKWLK